MQIPKTAKSTTIFTAQQATFSGLFYMAAKNQVRNPEALKWICLACIGSAVLSGVAHWAIEKEFLHSERVFTYLKSNETLQKVVSSDEELLDAILPVAARLAELAIVIVLDEFPIVIAGAVTGEAKTAFVAFVLINFISPKIMLKIRKALFSESSVLSKKIFKMDKEFEERFGNELLVYGKLLNNWNIPAGSVQSQLKDYILSAIQWGIEDLNGSKVVDWTKS